MSIPSADAPASKRCVVVYASPARQYLWTVKLPAAASIADALAAARALAARDGEETAIPWDGAAVGIFGEPRARSAPCADGDRIEIYRPLPRDPRAQRRERLQRARRGSKSRA
jgi:uncharacterized protein